MHGDLTGANILVDDQLHAQIADFGLSVFVDKRIRGTGKSVGHVQYGWVTPEFLNGQIHDTASDVYCFAVTCIEVCLCDIQVTLRSRHNLDIQ